MASDAWIPGPGQPAFVGPHQRFLFLVFSFFFLFCSAPGPEPALRGAIDDRGGPLPAGGPKGPRHSSHGKKPVGRPAATAQTSAGRARSPVEAPARLTFRVWGRGGGGPTGNQHVQFAALSLKNTEVPGPLGRGSGSPPICLPSAWLGDRLVSVATTPPTFRADQVDRYWGQAQERPGQAWRAAKRSPAVTSWGRKSPPIINEGHRPGR